MHDAIYQCDSCGCQASGYTRAELLHDGWRWHPCPQRSFVMCGDCEKEYAERRRQRTAAAA